MKNSSLNIGRILGIVIVFWISIGLITYSLSADAVTEPKWARPSCDHIGLARE